MAKRDALFQTNQIALQAITEAELNTSVGGNGIEGGGGSPLAVTPDITSTTTTEANAVIVASNGVSVKVDDSTLEGSLQGVAGAETIRVKALGIDTAELAADAVTNAKIADDQIDSEHYVDGSIDNQHIADDTILEVKLDVTNAPTDGFFLTFDNATGGFTWVESPAVSGVQEADLQYDDFTASLNGILTDFTLTDIPVVKSLQVYINSGVQRRTVAYDLNPGSGQTQTIRINGDVLLSGEKLEAYYVIDN